MEEGLGDWCQLEYRHICSFIPQERLVLLRFPEDLDKASLVSAGSPAPRSTPERLTSDGAAAFVPYPWERVCLLDMDAEEALQPDDVGKFDAFVFGGILGNVIENEDGSYGSDDRTAELRKLGFTGRRHLGPMQMTTDTAVLVSNMVLEDARALAEIAFLDSPEIAPPQEDSKPPRPADVDMELEACGAGDCICMEGFRYVARRGADGEWEPTLPQGMKELLLKDADNDILGSM